MEGEESGEDEEMSLYEFTSSMMPPKGMDVPVPKDSMERERRMTVLQEALKLVVVTLQVFELKGIFCQDQ